MNIYQLPHLHGVAVDNETARRFDDIFWVQKKDKEYTLTVCVPSMSQRDFRTSPKYRYGFVLGQQVPSVCFEFIIKTHHNTLELRSFRVYECWAQSISNINYHTKIESLPEHIQEMFISTGTLVRTLKRFFHKSGIFTYNQIDKEAPEILNTHFLMEFTNVVVANFAVQHNIPLLYYDLEKEYAFEVNVGLLKILPHYAQVTSPLRRIGDLVNQCNLVAFFKEEEYPLGYDDLRDFGFDDQYLLVPRTFSKKVREQISTGDKKILTIELEQVVGEDYVHALEVTYRTAQKPLPVYMYDQPKTQGKRQIQCTVVVVDFVTSKPFSRSITALRKDKATTAAAKDVYEFLMKKYPQKKAG